MPEYVEVSSVNDLERFIAKGETVYLKKVNGGFHPLSPEDANVVLCEKRILLDAGLLTYVISREEC